MADDLSGLQNSLSSLERLTQRLVVLFEKQLQEGTPRRQRNATPSATNATTTPAAAVTSNIEATNKALVETAENTADAAKSAKKQARITHDNAESSATLTQSQNELSVMFNKFVDGSIRMRTESRQALNTLSSLATTTMSSFAKFESSSARAVAASNGLLTTTQWAQKSVGYASTAIRNITQFGPIVGGIVSSVEIIADIFDTQRKEIEVRVADIRKYAELEQAHRLELLKIQRGSVTSAQAELMELRKEQSEAEAQIESAIRARKELSDNTTVTQHTVAGTLIESRHVKPGTIDEKDVLIQEELATQKRAESKQRKLQIDKLTKATEAERVTGEIDAAMQEKSLKLRSVLFDITRASNEKDFEGIKERIQLHEKELQAQLKFGGDLKSGDFERNAEVYSAIISGKKLMQQADIESIKLRYDKQKLALENDPIRDAEGRVREGAMAEAQKALLDQMIRDTRDVTSSFNIPSGEGLSQQQQIKLRDEAAGLKDALGSVLEGYVKDFTGLDLATPGKQSKDALTKTQDYIRDLNIKSEAELALAKPGTLFGSVDPMGSVRAKRSALEREIFELDAQKSVATGESKATLLALFEQKNRDLDKLNNVDAIIAERAAQVLTDGVKIDQIVRDIGRAETRNTVDAVGRGRISDRRSRQLLAAGGLEGSADLIGVGTQRAEFEKSRALAQKSVNTWTAQYNEAKRQQKSEETILDLRRKMIDSQTELARMMAQQEEVVAKQIATVRYDLIDDKPSSDRFNRARRMNESREKKYSPGMYGKGGGGAEHARLTGDFNEYYRKQHGRLTDEEKDAAKEERRMQLQLGRARRAISIGSGTKKQRALVDYYNNQKEAQGPAELERIAKGVDEANNYLSTMATGLPKQGR